MTKEISQLPASSGLIGTDLFASKKGASDFSLSGEQVSTYVLGNLSDQDVLDKLKNVDGAGSGLDADLLQGLLPSFFRDAGNLNAGTVPDARLPQGTLTTYFQAGGIYNNAGRLRCVLKIPNFLFMTNLMVQFGHTYFIQHNQESIITFPEAFASGFTTEDRPWYNVAADNRSSNWPNPSTPGAAIELRCQGYDCTLTELKVAARREQGSGNDYVRGNYIAIGRY